MIVGNLASEPEPNSMRGKRESEKSVTCTGSFHIGSVNEPMVAILPTACLHIS
jgi:hypothetical protein